MTGETTIRIKYEGPGTLEPGKFGVPAPKPETVQVRALPWKVGDEMIPIRHGWFVHDVSVDPGGMFVYTVRLTPPD